MKKSLFTVFLLLLSLYSLAATKSFIKEDTAVVPSNQSQDQVISYLTQKLTREAIEEAGIFAKSELKIESGKITKEEITNITGSVSSIKVEEKETYTENKQQYVHVKVRVKVDTDSVKLFLEKIKEDNSYKTEIEELRKKNLELEQKLKKSSKQQYNDELSIEVKKQMELQKQMAIEYNKIALEAKKEFSKVKIEQEEKNAKRESDLAQLKADIIKEKEALAKSEIDSKNKIKELEIQAKANASKNQSLIRTTTIQEALKEATHIQQQIQVLLQEFTNLLQTQKETIENHYEEEIHLSCDDSPKSIWESDAEYAERIQRNQEIKKKLTAEKEENIFSSRKQIVEAMIPALSPLINSLQSYHEKSFEALDVANAEFLGISDVNRDELKFNIKIGFLYGEYNLSYDFSDIGLDKAKLLYETQNQFIVKPLFTVSNIQNKLDGLLVGFKIIHLGTGIEKEIVNLNKIKKCKEIEEYNTFLEEEANIKKIGSLDKQVQKYYNEFKNDENLKKFKVIISKIEKQLNTPQYLKYQNLKEYEDFVLKLEFLDVIAIDFFLINTKKPRSYSYDIETVSLLKYGQISYSGNEEFSLYNIKEWENIKSISYRQSNYVNGSYLIGKEKDGTIHISPSTPKFSYWENKKNIKDIVCGGYNEWEEILILRNNGDTYKKNINSKEILLWKGIKSITYYDGCFIGLKKDGQVLVHSEEYTNCFFKPVQNWTNIKKIWAGDGTVIGLMGNGRLMVYSRDKIKIEKLKKWQNIVDININYPGIYGLHKNGKVSALCSKEGLSRGLQEEYSQCQETKEWENIRDISNAPFIAITNDGKVVQSSEFFIPSVDSWEHIVKIGILQQYGEGSIVGLDEEGNLRESHFKKQYKRD